MRNADLVAVILFAATIALVLIPLWLITLSIRFPVPYPLGDPVFFGAILILICAPLSIVLWLPPKFLDFGQHWQNVKHLRKITFIGTLIGVALIMLALLTLSLLFMTTYSVSLFILCLIGFIFIPPRTRELSLNTKKFELST